MKIDSFFTRLWYVHQNGKFDSMYTLRREARDRKSELRANGASDVTISYVPFSLGTIQEDSHS